MNALAKFVMVSVVSVAGLGLGLMMGQEGVIGVVVGSTAIWFSPGFSLIGGLAGFGAFVGGWIIGEEIGLYLSK